MQEDLVFHAAAAHLFGEENEEGICGSIAPRILDFDDDDVSPLALLIYADDVCSSSSSATAAAVNAGTSVSTPPRCWDDVVSFSPFPSLDALFDTPPAQHPDPVPAVWYPSSTSSSSLNPPLPAMFPVPPPYAGNHHLNPFDHQNPMSVDAITNGYPPYSPDAPAFPPSHQHAAAHVQQRQALAAMEAVPTWALLEAGGIEACGGPYRFFYAGDVMAPNQALVKPANVAENQWRKNVNAWDGQSQTTPTAYGTDDLRVSMAGSGRSPTPLAATDISAMDDSSFKVGRLSVEERKEKIDRYMKKRAERNFSKKIKYACRKTLADSRPRIHGRFAKNDELGETAKSGSSNNDFDDEGEVVVKEEDTLDSDILAHISGIDLSKASNTERHKPKAISPEGNCSA
ncbi:CCT motif family protein [Musa troglodytarum]|nr:CCT motif family protein [Musa troglodytarum]URE04439.1 CCT motif family protein [Musa troglodytarum]